MSKNDFQNNSKDDSNNNSKLASKLPPSDLEAEKALLGSILLNKSILDDVADKLRSEFFYEPRHQVIYNVVLDLWSDNKPVDILFVQNSLENLKYTQNLSQNQIIDKDFLLDLISKSTLTQSPEAASSLIKDKFLLRTIVATADSMKSLAVTSQNSPQDILDQAQKSLYEISVESLDKNFVPLSELLDGTFERINELYENQGELRGLTTSFVDLDKNLGGLHKSDLIILAARPGMGKTALALEIVRRIAMNQQIGVAVFSLEMSKDQLVDRLLSSTSGIDSWKIRTGKFGNDEGNEDFSKLGEAISRLSETPIWIDDSGSLNILELRSKARRLKSRHNVGLIVIDYLQLMNGGNTRYGGNRVQEVSDISRGLKMLAKELDIPILALSQLSRSVEGRDDKRPMLSDLRESGSIEQDADVVIFVHREEMYHKDTEKKKGIADILVSKHRHGATFMVELAWIHRLATFENLEGAKRSNRVNE